MEVSSSRRRQAGGPRSSSTCRATSARAAPALPRIEPSPSPPSRRTELPMNLRPSRMAVLLLLSGLGMGCPKDTPEEVTDEAGTCAGPTNGTELPACPLLCDTLAQGEQPPAGADLSRDIRSTALNVKLDSLEATALIQVAGSPSNTLSLKVGSLRISGVSSRCGPLRSEERR